MISIGDRTIALLRERWPELVLRFTQHLELIGIALFFATLIGIGLGLMLASRPRLAQIALTAANAVQTIPSLALLALLLPIFGIGVTPAIFALTLYAVMPILRNVLAALGEEPPGLVGIGPALGLTPGEIVWHIKIPQGLPLFVSGMRTAAVWSVGTATLSAFIGAGGLGEFINRGISLLDPALLLLGAVPAALLALGIDAILGLLEADTRLWKSGHLFPTRKWTFILSLTGIVILFIGILSVRTNPFAAQTSSASGNAVPLRIGTKNFAEQLVLGELIAQYLEAHDIPVAHPLPAFQGTELIHGALVHGDIDLYVEYLGTAAQVILKLDVPPGTDPTAQVRASYAQQFHLAWLDSLGFSNTYAVIARSDSAGGAIDLSQFVPIAAKIRAGLNSEFVERSDGMPALEKTYGLHFAQVDTLDAGLLYTALTDHRVDAIVGFSTDAQLAQTGLIVLQDDRHAFPLYNAVPVVSDAALQLHPRLGQLLLALAGRFDEATMRRLNAEVQLKGRSPADVAHDYWHMHPLP